MDMNYTGLTYTIWNLPGFPVDIVVVFRRIAASWHIAARIPMRDRRGHSLPSALKKAFTQEMHAPPV